MPTRARPNIEDLLSDTRREVESARAELGRTEEREREDAVSIVSLLTGSAALPHLRDLGAKRAAVLKRVNDRVKEVDASAKERAAFLADVEAELEEFARRFGG